MILVIFLVVAFAVGVIAGLTMNAPELPDDMTEPTHPPMFPQEF